LVLKSPPIVPEGPSVIDRLRQTNIFNPQQGGAGMYDPNMYMNQGAPEPMESPAYDALAGLLEDRPEYEGPGMLKKIAASMMALNDPRLAMALLHQPDQELVDWQSQVGTAQKAAELEERTQRTRAATESAGRRATTAEERLDFDIEKFAAELSPADKQILELEQIDARGANVMEQIEARAAAARETGDERHANTLEAIAERARETRTSATHRAEETRETQRLKPTTTGATQLERGRSVLNNAQEVLARKPEWGDYVNVTDDGVKIEDAGYGSYWGGAPELTPEVRQEIVEAIYGGGTQEMAPAEGEQEVMEKEIPDGSGMAISTDGGKTWKRK